MKRVINRKDAKAAKKNSAFQANPLRSSLASRSGRSGRFCGNLPQKFKSAKLEFISLGCDKNLVDTEKFLARLNAAGYELVSQGKPADVMLINTCAFIDAAREESIDHILSAVERKKSGEIKVIIIAGCMVELYRQELRQEIPEVDMWLTFSEMDSMLRQSSGRPGNCRPPRFLTTPPHISYLKIAEGCDRGCRFCIIPKIRGRFRSVPEKELLREAKFLEQSGVRELNLVAQDLCDYGKDTGSSLLKLLDLILEKTSIPWIRLFYMNPEGISREMIELIASEKRICNYIDFPFQHISDPVLKAMGRPAREKKIRSLVDKLRSGIPGLSLRGTALVGFPGESEEDFEKLCGFVEDSEFDWLGVFAYSEQSGAASCALPGKVPVEIAGQRKEDLENLWRNLAEEKNQGKIGKVLEVVVDSRSDLEFDFQGRSQAQGYEIDGVVQLRGRFREGDFCRVKIVDSLGLDLAGVKIRERSGE